MADLSPLLEAPTRAHAVSHHRRALSPRVRLLVGLELFLALGAVAGGGAMLVDPTGEGQGLPADLLDGTPFRSYLVPGIVLLLANGLVPAAVAVLAIRRDPAAAWGHRAVAAVLASWMVGETVLIGWASWMQPFFFAYAAAVAALALWPDRPTDRGGGWRRGGRADQPLRTGRRQRWSTRWPRR